MAFGIIDTLVESAQAVRHVLRRARIQPDDIELPTDPIPLKIVVNASLAAAILLFANRCLLYPDSVQLLTSVVLNVIIAASSFIFIFVISTCVLLTQPDDKADAKSDKWSFVFVFVWLMTLVFFLLDNFVKIAFGASHPPLAFVIHRLAPGMAGGIDIGFLAQYFVYAALAVIVLWLKSRFVNGKTSSGFPFTFMVTVPVSAVALYLAMLRMPG